MATKDRQDKETSKSGRPALILLPLLIMTGLLLAPPTRSLLRTQCMLLFNSQVFSDQLRDLGVKESPLPHAQKWERSRPEQVVASLPHDYTIQVAGTLMAPRNSSAVGGITPQEVFVNFQRRYGAPFAALSQRFPNQPSPYAHLLRFMSQGTVRVVREADAAKFLVHSQPMQDRQVGFAEAWAAYDQAAARGEKLDPDNAYFPMMRAVGLFDARRDAEARAAILRAGQKTRFDDYALEEVEALRALYRRAYGMDSALLRECDDAIVLLPHFAALRSMGRLVTSQAAQAEEAGRPQEGMALRHAMMQCAERMRERGSPISALVAYNIFAASLRAPGGVKETAPPENATDEQKHTRLRDNYLAYLNRTGQREEAAWVVREDNLQTEARKLIDATEENSLLEIPVPALHGYWIADLLLLANTLILLCLCSLAVLLGRPKMPGGEKALPWVVMGVMVGSMFLAFPMLWAEGMTQLREVLMNLAFTAHPSGNDTAMEGMRMSEIIRDHPVVVHIGEVVLSLTLPLLVLLAAGIGGLFRKEPFSAALARTLQRGGLVFLTCLTLLYAACLIATARLEARANAIQDGREQNAVVYLQQHSQSGHRP